MPTGLRARLAGAAAGAAALLPLHATETPIQEISPLVWVMVAISAAGAFITYAIMVYAVWRFRDPSTKRRNYG